MTFFSFIHFNLQNLQLILIDFTYFAAILLVIFSRNHWESPGDSKDEMSPVDDGSGAPSDQRAFVRHLT